jgi:mannose-6-phosphate isomerase-like protein (cupin superfamily)
MMRRELKRALCVLSLGLVGCVGKNFGAGSAHAPRPAIQHTANEIVFRPGPPNMPKGVEMVVLEGDPKAEGTFTIRLKAPASFSLAPHTHPADERVTVLEGTVSVGFGSATDRTTAKTFGAGSFYLNPANVAHYVFSDEGATLQITGEGPWRVDFLQMP